MQWLHKIWPWLIGLEFLILAVLWTQLAYASPQLLFLAAAKTSAPAASSPSTTNFEINWADSNGSLWTGDILAWGDGSNVTSTTSPISNGNSSMSRTTSAPTGGGHTSTNALQMSLGEPYLDGEDSEGVDSMFFYRTYSIVESGNITFWTNGEVAVSLDGVELGITTGNTTWNQFSYSTEGNTGANKEIRFANNSPSGNMYIDDIVVPGY